jgi:hypothetical protein
MLVAKPLEDSACRHRCYKAPRLIRIGHMIPDRRSSFSIFLLLSLTACNTTQTSSLPSAREVGSATSAKTVALTESERDALLRATISCMYRSAEKLDDGTSPANTVGSAVGYSCLSEYERSFIATGNPAYAGLNQQAFHQSVSDGSLDRLGTLVVLNHRSKKRQN